MVGWWTHSHGQKAEPKGDNCSSISVHEQKCRKSLEMPFRDNVYYPFTNDMRGAHSLEGLPSLLNSKHCPPFPNSVSAPGPGMAPSLGVATFPPFRFRPRREIMDWQQISEVDINQVMSQVDVDVLQENISMMTFCSLDGERCQRCRSPVDPALLKIMQLAQLTVEWLLHCQDFLTLNLRAVEDKLAAASREQEQQVDQQRKQEEKVKMLSAKLKERKKEVWDLQSQLYINSHKCHLCHKAFVTPKFLQRHMQRRHQEDYESKKQIDTEKESQVDILKSEISSLREQNAQLQQKLQLKVAQEKEQLSKHQSQLRVLEHFKVDEMARMDQKIEDTRDNIRREMEMMYNLNMQALNEMNQNQVSFSKMQINETLERQMWKQNQMYDSNLQELKALHEFKTNHLLDEMSRLSVSDQQDRNQILHEEMSLMRQEIQQTIKAQKEEERKTPSPVAEPVAESSPAISEPLPVTNPRPTRTMSSLRRRIPNVKKEILTELLKRLGTLGVRPNQSGLKNAELSSMLDMVYLKQYSVANKLPTYWCSRKDIASSLETKIKSQIDGVASTESQTCSRESLPSMPVLQRSRSLPSCGPQVSSGPVARRVKTPQSLPRARNIVQSSTSPPVSNPSPQTNSFNTSLFTSEDSDEPDQGNSGSTGQSSSSSKEN